MKELKGESDSYDFNEPYIDEERRRRSVLVKSLPPSTDKQSLTIYFQSRKNCGGDVQEVILLKNGSAVITFEEEQVAKSVQKKEQKMEGVLLSIEPYVNPQVPEMEDLEVFFKVSGMIQPRMINLSMAETHALLEKVREETKIEVSKPRRDVYILSGSFQQIKESRRLLKNILFKEKVYNGNGRLGQRLGHEAKESDVEHHVNGLEEAFEDENETRISRRRLDDQVKTTSNPFSDSFRSSILDKESTSYHYSPLKKEVLKARMFRDSSLSKDDKYTEATLKNLQGNENQDTEEKTKKEKYDCTVGTGDKATDDTQKIFISNKEWHMFVKMYEEELQSIMSKFSVQIKPEDDASVAVIKPLGEYNKENLSMAVRKISVLYEEAKKKMVSVRFVLADLENKEDESKLRKLILEVKKTFRVVLEKTADRQSWEIFGESEQVEKGMRLLKESVKLKVKERDVGDEAIKSDADEIDIDNDTASADDDDDDDSDGDSDDDDDDYNEKLEHYLGKVKLSVYKGDITEENCDAIVNAANENLYHGAGVARAIVSKGGSSIQDECRRIVQSKQKLKVGEAIVTHSGRLRCKMIIHAVGPRWSESQGEKGKALLNKACTESLIQAQKYNFKSIAFPAISSGIFGFPKTLCAQVMFDVAEEYSKRVTSSTSIALLDIRFVNNDVKTVKIFRKEFKARYGNGYLISEDKQDAKSRESNNLPRNSRTLPNKESNTTVQIKNSGLSGYSAVTSFSEEVKKREAHPRNQKGQSALSSDNVITRRSSGDFSLDNKKEKITKHQKQSVNDKISDVLPKGEESRFQSHSNHQGKYDSFSGSGARPKLKSSNVKKKAKDTDLRPASSSSNKSEGEHQKCPICLNKIIQPKTLPKCKHTFCKVCLVKALEQSPWCPYCRDPQPSKRPQLNHHVPHGSRQDDQLGISEFYSIATQWTQRDSHPLDSFLFGQPISQPFGMMDLYDDLEEPNSREYRRKPRGHNRENQAFDTNSVNDYPQDQFGFPNKQIESLQMQERSQPIGSMMSRQESFSLPGYEPYGTIVIQYSFSGGLQGPCHPNPGQRYNGTSRSAYLPDCPEGRKVLKLLRHAFDAGLIFKIGRSMTSRMDNQIIWADIPHKTSTSGGPNNYGYPDSKYLADVTQQLKAALSSIRS